jgi:allantoin racemase
LARDLQKARHMTAQRILVINPNTGQATTDRLLQHLPVALPLGTSLTCVTARFGAPYIACEASYAVAGHALLDAWAHAMADAPENEQPRRVLIGCFGDPGLHALRESCAYPVTGLAEASFIEASSAGPFAIVTGGQRWQPMLERLALSLGYAQHLQHIETVPQSGAQLLADPVQAVHTLTAACQRAASQNVKAIILGGAGLAGFAALVQPSVSIPVIDSVHAGARVVMGSALPVAQRTSAGFDVEWAGLSPAMHYGLHHGLHYQPAVTNLPPEK